MEFNKNIPEIEKKIGYTFKDKSLLKQAFTRSSFCNENRGQGRGYISNEILEFFGDSVLSTAIISMMLKTYVPRKFFMMYLSRRVNSFMSLCYYNLLVTRLTMMFFQVLKSPAMICFLASPTSQR